MMGSCQILILAKSTSHESNHEEIADKPELRDRPQNSLRKPQGHGSKGKIEDHLRLKEVKDTGQQSVTCNSELDPFAIKNIIGTIGNIGMESEG